MQTKVHLFKHPTLFYTTVFVCIEPTNLLCVVFRANILPTCDCFIYLKDNLASQTLSILQKCWSHIKQRLWLVMLSQQFVSISKSRCSPLWTGMNWCKGHLLGISMCIMCLTLSTWKVRSDKMVKLEAQSRWCQAVLCLSHLWVSERSKSLGCLNLNLYDLFTTKGWWAH